MCSLWDHIGQQEFLWKPLCGRLHGSKEPLPEDMKTYREWFAKGHKERYDAAMAAKEKQIQAARARAQIGVRVMAAGVHDTPGH